MRSEGREERAMRSEATNGRSLVIVVGSMARSVRQAERSDDC